MGRISAVVAPVCFWGAVIWYFTADRPPDRSKPQNTISSTSSAHSGYGAPSKVPAEVRRKAELLLEATYDGRPLVECKGRDIDGVYLTYCLRRGLEHQGGGLYAVRGAVPNLFSVYPINGKAKGHLNGYRHIVDEFGQETRIGEWDGDSIDINFATTMLKLASARR